MIACTDPIPVSPDDGRMYVCVADWMLVDLEEELPIRGFVPSDNGAVIQVHLPHLKTMPAKRRSEFTYCGKGLRRIVSDRHDGSVRSREIRELHEH